MELADKIRKLKNAKDAVILAHNYQPGEVQDIADYVGDSLGLAIEASKTAAGVIVFCGVHFMAETAAILNPKKKVLMPDRRAGCPMADMITAKGLKELKGKHPGVPVVAYVNTPAEVKAESDICCTSANSVEVVRSLAGAREVIFVPDKFLGMYTARFVDKNLILWPGYCSVHAGILPEHINNMKQKHPDAKVMVHPECRPETIDLADKVLSTGGMSKWVKISDAKKFIVGTEIGILHKLSKENPDKEFYPASEKAVCPNMKRTSLEKVLWSLEDMKDEINVADKISVKAKDAIEKMLKVKLSS